MLTFLLAFILTLPIQAPTDVAAEDTTAVRLQKPRPYLATGLTLSINAVMNVFDRICYDDPCYNSNWNSFKNNLISDWVWDNDSFYRNQIGHPIQGAFFFDAARACGLGYWGSGLMTALGSVSWEFFCENDPPSINDFLSTTAGGMATGEVLWRLYGLVKDRKSIDFPLRVSAGVGANFGAGTGAQAFLDVAYGDAFETAGKRPYDWFTLNLRAGAGSNGTSGVQQVSIIGSLYGKSFRTQSGNDLLLGLFQHFNYYDSPGMDVSESNSFGPGIVARINGRSGADATELQAHLGAMIMGGVHSEYYNVLQRNYTMTSGFSFHGSAAHDWGDAVSATLKYDHYHMFSAQEYDRAYLEAGGDPLLLNSRGNRMTSNVDILRMLVDVRCGEHLAFRFAPGFSSRRNRYSFYDSTAKNVGDLTVGLCWRFTNK